MLRPFLKMEKQLQLITDVLYSKSENLHVSCGIVSSENAQLCIAAGIVPDKKFQWNIPEKNAILYVLL